MHRSMFFWLFLLLIPIVICDYQHVQEMSFKFWLYPGIEECYHEILEKGSKLYFMYEILNSDTNGDHIIAYLRNTYNKSTISVSRTPQRGHLELSTNETTPIDICMDHETSDSYAKYLSIFFHVYNVDKILDQIKHGEEFDNSTMKVHDKIDEIAYHLIVTREHQIEVEMINQKDFYLLEKNLLWINRWALIHIFIIFSCVLFQTYFIKRLFKSNLRK